MIILTGICGELNQDPLSDRTHLVLCKTNLGSASTKKKHCSDDEGEENEKLHHYPLQEVMVVQK